jgi:hypothetical protein
MPLDQVRFLYLDTGNSFLWIDNAREYYFITDKYWLDTCKELSKTVRVQAGSTPPILSGK